MIEVEKENRILYQNNLLAWVYTDIRLLISTLEGFKATRKRSREKIEKLDYALRRIDDIADNLKEVLEIEELKGE